MAALQYLVNGLLVLMDTAKLSFWMDSKLYLKLDFQKLHPLINCYLVSKDVAIAPFLWFLTPLADAAKSKPQHRCELLK